MTARLHVLLGPGGVGKTTLAAGYALALARRGARVGLLGIDPSRRLQDTLGVTLGDEDVAVSASLRAAIVEPHRAIARWIAEACDADARARLERNPFFAALGDRLATATDVLAAVRLAEWAERDRALTDLVVDTAPGLAALEFLRAPRQLAELVEGRLVRWLRAAARPGSRVRGRARRIVGAFSGIAGADLVLQLAELFALSRAPLARMLARVESARAWLASPDAELLLVTSPRDTGGAAASQLAAALAREGLAPHAWLVNRTLPAELARELASAADSPFVSYVRAQLAAQATVLAVAGPDAIVLPSVPTTQRAALAELGELLVRAEPTVTRSAS